jgi:integral membrane protein
MDSRTLSKTLTDRFLWVGKVEGYSYLLLLGVAMPLKYAFDMPEWVRVVGMLHGVLFIAFMVLLAAMFFKVKMPFKNAAASFLLSLVPFGTFYLKHQVADGAEAS